MHGYCPAAVDASINDTNDPQTTTIKSFVTEDSGTMSSEPDDSNKTSRGVSDDAMSSLSTESGRSILSSEYGIEIGACSLSEFASSALYAYKTPSTTTDSGNGGVRNCCSSLTTNSVARQRMDDFKDLPPELAAMVQKALHELDMRDFDEVIGDVEDIEAKADTDISTIENIDECDEEQEDENTVN